METLLTGSKDVLRVHGRGSRTLFNSASFDLFSSILILLLHAFWGLKVKVAGFKSMAILIPLLLLLLDADRYIRAHELVSFNLRRKKDLKS